jgi:hypothetical protein
MLAQISHNLEKLLYSLIEEQINDTSASILKELIIIKKSFEKITKISLIKKISLNKNLKLNEENISVENIIQKLIDLEYIEIKENENILIKIDNILNILLYPRYCFYVNILYGPKCLKIFEYLLEYGFYNLNNNKNQKINFERNDFTSLVTDGIIAKYNIQKVQNENKKECNNIFNINIEEIYKINYNLLNKIIFKEYIINYYKNYISMNFDFYELFKKVINSDTFSYDLKNYEKDLLETKIKDNFDYSNLLIKENNKITLNKDIIKYDLFFNSLEKIINLLYSSKHIRILKIIQRNENFNIFQISQKACLKSIEVEEIIDDLINIKIVKKIKKEENEEDNVFCLEEINESHINNIKEIIYDIIINIKFELKDKLKELQGRISKETEIQYVNKYYSMINSFYEILNCFNFLFKINN